MKDFQSYRNDEVSLNERLITFGKKRPKYNQVIILAGGAGSGKGFVTETLIGIEAKVFDVDKLKEQVLHSKGIKDKIKKKFNIDVSTLDLKQSKDVSTLHELVSNLKLDKKVKSTFLQAHTNVDRKPNIIFDVTMKDIKKLDSISRSVQEMGYKIENIHIIWVVNELETALQQNAERPRFVDPDIVRNTHELVSQTVSSLLKNNSLMKYMNGDMWMVFNKKFSDAVLKFGDNGGSYTDSPQIQKKLAKTKGEKYKYNPKTEVFYFKVKEQGKAPMNLSQIADKYIEKIKAYVPNPEVWN